MYKRVSWLIACILGAILPVALAIAHSHYLAKLDNDTLRVITSVDYLLNNSALTTSQKQAEIINLIAQKRDPQTTLFVYDTNGKMIFHPERPDLNGRVLTSYADPVVANAFKDLVKSANAYTESKVAYYWPDSAEGKVHNQMAYIRKLDNWNWVFAVSQRQAVTVSWYFVLAGSLVLLVLLFVLIRIKKQVSIKTVPSV